MGGGYTEYGRQIGGWLSAIALAIVTFGIIKDGDYEFFLAFLGCLAGGGLTILIIKLIHYIKGKDDRKVNKLADKRTEILEATVYEVEQCIDGKTGKMGTIVKCEYIQPTGNRVFFQSVKVLGKVELKVGDNCQVFYEKDNYENYSVVPIPIQKNEAF